MIDHWEGVTGTELGFDLRGNSACSAAAPRYPIVTSGDVEYVVDGCGRDMLPPSPAGGRNRLLFDPSDPAQASPAISDGRHVMSIRLLVVGKQQPDRAAANLWRSRADRKPT
jgi:hypothetical protein